MLQAQTRHSRSRRAALSAQRPPAADTDADAEPERNEERGSESHTIPRWLYPRQISALLPVTCQRSRRSPSRSGPRRRERRALLGPFPSPRNNACIPARLFQAILQEFLCADAAVLSTSGSD